MTGSEFMHRLIAHALLLVAALVAIPASAGVIYYHTDHLGSVVAVTDAQGEVIERREYEPFGLRLGDEHADGPGYTSHVHDRATGLDYMQQRYYDPVTGSFLSVDPVTAYYQPSVAFNRYHYANNNPYKFTDPDGRFGIAGGIIGGIIEVGIQMGVEGKSFSQIDKTNVAVAVAVGAVTGGLGGRLATQAAKGAMTTGRAAVQTGKAGGAASALGSGAKDVANGEAPDGVKMAVSGAIGGAASGAGARIGLSSVSNLERAAVSATPGASNIASTTQSALRVGEVTTTGGQASAQVGVDAAAGALDKAAERQVDKRR